MENVALKENDSATRVPVVYVVQDDGMKNLLPAMRFGRLEPLITGRDTALYNVGPTVQLMRQKLRYILPSDYLLLVGDPVAIGIAAAIAVEFTGGKLKVLKWDRQERTYYPLDIDVHTQIY